MIFRVNRSGREFVTLNRDRNKNSNTSPKRERGNQWEASRMRERPDETKESVGLRRPLAGTGKVFS